MSFVERLAGLGKRAAGLLEHLETEEATKNALVMPFIAALGYDVFNPKEVVPEFTADVGIKKGEKVDYAIKREAEIVMLIECKKAGTDLSQASMSQLYRYFSATKARIGVLTNGVEYRFFSDLEEPNKMDEKPFLELDILDLRDNLVSELRRLSKDRFDLDRMLSAANQLKYMNEIKRVLTKQLDGPDEDFVRYFFQRANPTGRFVASAREEFTPLVKNALQQFISERVSDRLRSALETEEVAAGRKTEEPAEEKKDEPRDDGIVTTEEEIEGYHIVKSIVREVVDPARIVHRDMKSQYSAVAHSGENEC